MEHPDISTISFVSPNDLNRFRRIHDIPSSIELVVLDRGETPKTVRAGYSIGYTPFFYACGLSFPIPPSLLTILADLGLAFPQMNPNFVRHALVLLVRAAEARIPFGVEQLHRMCSIKSNSSFPGSFYLSPRKTRSVFEDIPARDDRWKEKYFFFRVNAHSVGSFDFDRLPTVWAPRVVVPTNIGLDKPLIAALKDGDCSWPNFTRERIRRALGTDNPQPAVISEPEIDPLNPPSINRPANFHQIPIGTSCRGVLDATSSSTSHHSLIRRASKGKMTRRPSAREAEKARKNRAQAGSSGAVRTGEIRRAVSDALEQASRAYETPATGLPADPTSRVISLSSRDSERTSRPKKPRVEDPAPDRRSNSSNGSGGSIPYGWTFNHTKGCPIADDPEGVAFFSGTSSLRVACCPRFEIWRNMPPM
ncbi:meiosis-specific protein ASY2-like [Eutrema salsugineum]|uniref:meiosis-specific protein ASY2-like n=1 Tax=Eutrema salsugineum TaxID=72664 RepID=UPI000CED00A9|nr:meiosis-specific protein ASY2-like [Eutrema salsugineum]